MFKIVMNPSVFFSLWFTIVFLCSLAIFNYPLTFNLFIVIIFVLLSSIAGFLFSLKSKEKSTINLNVETKNLRRIFLITMFFWCYDQLHILSGMFQYFDITNPKNTKDLITQSFFENEGLGFSESGKGISTIINTLFYIIGFPSLFIGAYYMTQKKYIGVIPLLLGSLTSLISFSRFHMFIYLTLSIYSFFFFKKINNQPINIKKSFVIIFLIATVLFGIPALLRSDGIEFNFLNFLGVYIFGGFAAFNNWLSNNFNEFLFIGNFNGTSFYTLKTWISYIGIVTPPSNLHYDFIYISHDDYTNVYSLFRPLIEDFGFFLSMFLIFCFCFIAGILFRITYYYKRIEFLPILAFQFTFTVFLFYTSILSDFRIFLGCFFSVFVFKSIFKTKRILNNLV